MGLTITPPETGAALTPPTGGPHPEPASPPGAAANSNTKFAPANGIGGRPRTVVGVGTGGLR
jgi:hypothetical protein